MISIHISYDPITHDTTQGDDDWIDVDKPIVKHDFPKGDYFSLQFAIRFYPLDVTQVIQYVTLYQVFVVEYLYLFPISVRLSSSVMVYRFSSLLTLRHYAQVFLATLDAVIHNEYELSNTDAVLLAALALQVCMCVIRDFMRELIDL